MRSLRQARASALGMRFARAAAPSKIPAAAPLGVVAAALLTAGAAAPAQATEAKAAGHPPDAVASCRPPRYYSFKLSEGRALLCRQGPASDILKVTIPDTGRALARAVIAFKNTHPRTTHYYSAALQVGTPIVNFAAGSDLCGDSSTERPNQFLGYGTLSAAAQTVTIVATQGSHDCTDGALVARPGGRLEVWVEDDAPHCVGRSIHVASWMDNVRRRTGKLDELFRWKFDPVPIHDVTVARNPAASRLRLLSSVEGSPRVNPNEICGRETEKLTIEHRVGRSVVGRQDALIPATRGMGHAMLGLDNTVKIPKNAKSMRAGLYVAREFGSTPVTTGGCCGDGILAAIQY